MDTRLWFRKPQKNSKNKTGRVMAVFWLENNKSDTRLLTTQIRCTRAEFEANEAVFRGRVLSDLILLQTHLFLKINQNPNLDQIQSEFMRRKKINIQKNETKKVIWLSDIFDFYQKSFSTKKRSTATTYGACIKIIKRNYTNIEAEKLTVNYAENLHDKFKLKYKGATPYNLILILNTALNYAVKNKLIKENNIKDFRPKPPEPVIIFLTEPEHDLIKNSPETPTRDLFLLMIETGLSYVDTQAFNVEIECIENNKYFSGNRQKTGSNYFGKFSELAQKILNKYGQKPPVIHYKTFSNNLRKLVLNCGIEKKITGHKARHTLAFKVINKTGNLSLVADMLGDNIRTVERYYGKMSIRGFASKLKNSGL